MASVDPCFQEVENSYAESLGCSRSLHNLHKEGQKYIRAECSHGDTCHFLSSLDPPLTPSQTFLLLGYFSNEFNVENYRLMPSE